MSYCRFSTDDFQCDVYVYEASTGGYQVYVASNRTDLIEPLPPPITLAGGVRLWLERYAKVQDIRRRSPSRPIGLSRDGESFNPQAPGETAELLRSLRDEGYRIPAEVIEALRAEAEESQRRKK